MKKTLFLTIAVLISSLCYAQKIDGVGKIRLGMTISELHNIFGEDLKPAKDFNNGITKTFVLSKYIPVEGYYINDFNLSFYNDSLYAMYSIEDTNMKEAFSIKYGEPKMEIEKEVKKYGNGIGNTVEKVDQSFNFTWDTGDSDIICYYTDKVIHDLKGNPTRYTAFGIENQRIFNKIKEDKLHKDEKRDDEQRQSKLKELEGL